MKKLVLLLTVACMMGGAVIAKEKKNKKKSETKSEQPSLQLNGSTDLSTAAPDKSAAPASNLKLEDLAFDELTHDWGMVMEGPDATTKFTFVNKGNEPLVIQKAQASCGCTVPSYSKEPVAPGATGSIDVAFHTQGKPAGAFTKTITITSNAGVRVLTIKGLVEKAPTASVPENASMVKTN